MPSPIIGIDLGTTNSEVAVISAGRPATRWCCGPNRQSSRSSG